MGYFGYGQGRAVAEYGESAVADKAICFDVCVRSAKCREKHASRMDARFPELSQIVKKTIASAQQTGLPPVDLVISAMNVAVRRDSQEALRIKEGLKKFKVESMTDHYVYGQLENLDNGINKLSPDAKPLFILIGASNV